jgi:hypothetical protein
MLCLPVLDGVTRCYVAAILRIGEEALSGPYHLGTAIAGYCYYSSKSASLDWKGLNWVDWQDILCAT